MPIFLSHYFLVLISIPILSILYFPLWGFGILFRDAFLDKSPLWFLFSHLWLPIIFFTIDFIKNLYQESNMDSLFYRASIAIVIGMFLWVLLSFQIAL